MYGRYFVGQARYAGRLLWIFAVLSALALLAVSADASDTLFSDDFETSFAGWAISSTPDWYTGTPKNGTHSIQFRQVEAIQRVISTSGYANIVVSFALAANGLDNSGEIMRASYYDGATWITLKQIAGGSAENDRVLRTYSYALPAPAGNNAGFRLRFDLTSNNHNNDQGYVDDIIVTGERISYSLSLTGSGSGAVKVNGTTYALPWSGSFVSGSSVTLEAVPQSGWAFGNWSGDVSGSVNPVTVTMDAAKSISATFSQLSYTLSLTGSGSGSVKVNGTTRSLPWSGSFLSDSTVILEAVPQSGWAFGNWSGDASGSTNPITVTMDGVKSITTTFNQLSYTLSLTGSGSGSVRVNGTGHSLPWSGQFLSSSEVTLQAVPQSGWEFASWSGDASGSANPVTITMSGAKDVATTFNRINYTLSLTKVGSGSVKVNGTTRSLPWSGQFYSGEQVTLLATAADGWRFDGWSGDTTWPGDTLIVTMDNSKSVTANFDQLSYTLSISKAGSGAVEVNGTRHSLPWSDSFLSGTVVTLVAKPATGWRFEGWSGDATWENGTLIVTMSNPKNLTATFSEETFTLSLAKTGEGSVKVNGTVRSLPWSGEFVTGSELTLEAIPDDEWDFKRWSGDANWSGAILTVTLDDNKSITAEFEEARTLAVSITSVGSGSIEINGLSLSLPWSGELERNSQVTMQAVPATGWEFEGWSGDVTSVQNPILVTVNHRLDIEVEFSQIQCQLSLVVEGDGAITVNGESRDLPSTETHAYGSEITLIAVADSGWLFTGWSGDVTGTTNPLSIEITADLSVTATFIQPGSFTLSLTETGIGVVKVDGVEVNLPWSGEFTTGTEVTLEAVPAEGELFTGWTGDITSETNPIIIVMDGVRSINANFSCATGPFADVSCDYWAAAAIQAVRAAGIALGYSDGNYLPSVTVTRAGMAVYLARAIAGGEEQIPAGPEQPTFNDVATDHWAYAAIEYICANNIASGYGDGSYQPAWQITRAQMAAFIARAIVEPMGEGGIASYQPPSKPTFPDVPTSMWCYRHVEYLASQGIVAGYSDGLYRPSDNVTRDQMAVYIARAFDLLN